MLTRWGELGGGLVGWEWEESGICQWGCPFREGILRRDRDLVLLCTLHLCFLFHIVVLLFGIMIWYIV